MGGGRGGAGMVAVCSAVRLPFDLARRKQAGEGPRLGSFLKFLDSSAIPRVEAMQPSAHHWPGATREGQLGKRREACATSVASVVPYHNHTSSPRRNAPIAMGPPSIHVVSHTVRCCGTMRYGTLHPPAEVRDEVDRPCFLCGTTEVTAWHSTVTPAGARP